MEQKITKNTALYPILIPVIELQKNSITADVIFEPLPLTHNRTASSMVICIIKHDKIKAAITIKPPKNTLMQELPSVILCKSDTHGLCVSHNHIEEAIGKSIGVYRIPVCNTVIPPLYVQIRNGIKKNTYKEL